MNICIRDMTVKGIRLFLVAATVMSVACCLHSTRAKAATVAYGEAFEDPAFVLSAGRMRVSELYFAGYTSMALNQVTISAHDDGIQPWVEVAFDDGAFEIRDTIGELLDGFVVAVEVQGAEIAIANATLNAIVEGDSAAYLDFRLLDHPLPFGSTMDPFATLLMYRDTLYGDQVSADAQLDGRTGVTLFGSPQVNTYSGSSYSAIRGFRIEFQTVPEPTGLALSVIGALCAGACFWRYRLSQR